MADNFKEYHCNDCNNTWKSNDFFPICVCRLCGGTNVTYYDVRGLSVIHISTVKNFDGLIDFTVAVSETKEYTFTLKSEADVKMVEFLLKRKLYGKAMVYLKKASLKEVEHGRRCI